MMAELTGKILKGRYHAPFYGSSEASERTGC
jgi:hypothetical protein